MLSLPSIMQHTFYFRWHQTYREHQISTRTHDQGSGIHEEAQRRHNTKISKSGDILKILKLRTMTTYINEYYWHKRAQCSRFHQNVLPEDGPVKPKHVARNRIYFNDILRTFWRHCSEFNMSLASSKIKSVLHYRRKRKHEWYFNATGCWSIILSIYKIMNPLQT
jgi:hypothetical protein